MESGMHGLLVVSRVSQCCCHVILSLLANVNSISYVTGV